VVDYGGLFWGDVTDIETFPPHDHRRFRPAGWIEAGNERIEEMRPIAERRGLTPLQLACQWNLSHPAVRCVVPTLIQEAGEGAKPIEDKRAELSALPEQALTADDVAEIRRIGDNQGCMALKGATPAHEGEAAADSWPLNPELVAAGERWGVDPDRDLVMTDGA
jgi:aryl-alcohol dehydrogenase-like predicted oxidoreductase